MQASPEATNDSIRAGPVLSWAATPVSTKMPVPMTAPTPRAVSCSGPSTRRRRFSPFISSSRRLRGLVANRGLAKDTSAASARARPRVERSIRVPGSKSTPGCPKAPAAASSGVLQHLRGVLGRLDGAVRLLHLAVGADQAVRVAQQREVVVELLREAGVGLLGVEADAEDLHALLVVLVLEVAEPA